MKRIFFLPAIVAIPFVINLSSCEPGSAQEVGNMSSPQSMINQDEISIVTSMNDNASSSFTSTGVSENPPSKSPPMTSRQLKGAEEIIATASPSGTESVDAKFIFKLHCAVCHGFKGNANVNGATDLTKSRISLVESVAHINYGRGLMTPYNVLLSKEEIVAVSKYSQNLR